MRLVIDANIFFAALITHGFTEKLILDTRFALYAPTWLFEEMHAHRKTILEKSHGTEEQLDDAIRVIQARITLVDPTTLLPKIISRADACAVEDGDRPYVALALALGCGIWSTIKG